MKKAFKTLIWLIIILIIFCVITFLIDYSRCNHFKEPIFVVAGVTADDGGSGTYYGAGYKVKIEKTISAEYGPTLVKIEMYVFNRFLVGAIADTNNNIDNEYDNTEGNHQFVATIINIDNNHIIVEPEEDSKERKSSDKISIGISKLANESDEFNIGNKVKITYNGIIMESYPAQIVATKIELLK